MATHIIECIENYQRISKWRTKRRQERSSSSNRSEAEVKEKWDKLIITRREISKEVLSQY